MDEVYCLECGWSGSFSELINDSQEDGAGDLVGEHLCACPSCYGPTVDAQDLDDDLDTYACG